MKKSIMILFFLFSLSAAVLAQPAADTTWQTWFERSGYVATPRYQQSIEYFAQFAKQTPFASLTEFGRSPQGRPLYALVVSKDKAFTPAEAKKLKKPVVMVINGIHSGEIEGKEACMILLREMLITREQQKLLDSVILVIVPVFSVDGHERFSANNRINQNGPEEMGWRTTAQNLNLNRDWIKADAPEMQAMLQLFNAWLPDFFIDTHTTDGADFQYSANYGLDKFYSLYPQTADMVRAELIPFLERHMEQKGHFIAPYVDFKDHEIRKGLIDWPGSPRFSTGYTSARNRIGLLVETHMLKPYKQRVFATKAMLESALEFINGHAAKLVALNKKADSLSVEDFVTRHKPMPIGFKITDEHEWFVYRGINYKKEQSSISGKEKIVYTGQPFTDTIPYYNHAIVTDSLYLPYAYIIPPEYKVLAERLQYHGISVQQTTAEQTLPVTIYQFSDVSFNTAPYENRQVVNAVTINAAAGQALIPAGSYIVYSAQQAVRVIAHALEPKSEDSFLRWGFMNAIFERKEYFEEYVMERIGPELLAGNPGLRKEFEAKLASDEKFRNNGHERLRFLYDHSPYADKNLNRYPVFRVEKEMKIL